MLNIDKLTRDELQKEFFKFEEDIPENWEKWIKCLLSKEYLMDSRFYQYLLSKERTELIDKILNDNN